MKVEKILIPILLLTFLTGCVSLRPNPRPWTKGEKTAAGFYLVAHSLDAYTTEKILDHPYYWELNPILGRHPSDGKIIFYFSITAIVTLLIGHLYPKTRVPLFMGYGGINAGCVLHNKRVLDNIKN